MSPKASARIGSTLALALAVSCGDATRLTQPAGETAALLRSALPAAHDETCTIQWANPAGGEWTTATNWNPQRLPTSTDNVCITLDATYTVNTGSATVNTVTIGNPANATVQALNVRAYGASATLTATNGIVNHGYLALSALIVANNMVATVAVPNGTLVNHGTIRGFADGVGSQRAIAANVHNLGAFFVESYMTFNKAGAVFENRGSFDMNSHARISMAGNIGQTFRQSAGTLTIPATAIFQLTGETFEFDGGTVTGTPVILNGKMDIGSGNEDAGSFTLRGHVGLTGDVAPAQTLDLQAIYPTHSVLKAATGFTNAGTIILSWTYGGDNQTRSTLEVTEGTLVNTGTLRMATDGIGSPRSIRADIDNRGTIAVDRVTTFEKVGGVLENRGTITIATSQQLNFPDAAQVFRQLEGTLTITGAGSMTMTGGTFEMTGGAISGKPSVDNGLLRFVADASGSGVIGLRGTTAKIAGDIPAGFTVTAGNLGLADALLTAEAGFTNRGTLVLASLYGGNNGTDVTLTVTNGALTNLGTLATAEGGGVPGSVRNIDATLVNHGTLNIGPRTHFIRQSGQHVSDGPITFNSTGGAIVVWGLGQSFTTSAAITGGGSFDLKDMTLKASGTAAARFTLNNVAAHIGSDGPATLSVNGTWTMQNGGSLNVEVGSGGPGVGYDQLNLSGTQLFFGTVTMTGTLNAAAAGGVCVEPGQAFDIMTYRARSADFTTKNLSLGDGRALTATVGTTSYRLTSTGPACPLPDTTAPVITPSVSGTMGNNGWYVSNVTVTWSVVDEESPLASTTGCEATTVSSDTDGTTFTCSATSSGGTSSQSVTIKRDATAPAVSATRLPAANTHGWNNTSVTATYSASDATSGLSGASSFTQLFSGEGANQGGSKVFTDNAGNTATASIGGISIDMTSPLVTVTRSPLAGPTGWNDTDVIATWTATDPLSDIDGAAGATHVFSLDGAGQTATRSFSDRAGNSASATISNVNIDRTPAPPPTLSPMCSATPSVIWPANNKPVSVKVTVGGAGVTSYRLRSVTNNETGTADADGWAIGTADVEGFVLARRNGGGTGRTYTLTYDVFGAGGATGVCTVAVLVPHDQRLKP